MKPEFAVRAWKGVVALRSELTLGPIVDRWIWIACLSVLGAGGVRAEIVEAIRCGIQSEDRALRQKAIDEMRAQYRTNEVCRQLLVDAVWDRRFDVSRMACQAIGPMNDELAKLALMRVAELGMNTSPRAQFVLSGWGRVSWLGCVNVGQAEGHRFRVRYSPQVSVVVDASLVNEGVVSRLPLDAGDATIDFWVDYSLNFEVGRQNTPGDIVRLIRASDDSRYTMAGFKAMLLAVRVASHPDWRGGPEILGRIDATLSRRVSAGSDDAALDFGFRWLSTYRGSKSVVQDLALLALAGEMSEGPEWEVLNLLVRTGMCPEDSVLINSLNHPQATVRLGALRVLSRKGLADIRTLTSVIDRFDFEKSNTDSEELIYAIGGMIALSDLTDFVREAEKRGGWIQGKIKRIEAIARMGCGK